MDRCSFILTIVFLASTAFAQTPTATSDAKAITLATNSLAAMTGGTQVADITLKAKITSIAGSDDETGTGTFYAKGNDKSLLSISTDREHWSELRVSTNGVPSCKGKNADAAVVDFAEHNALTDAVWFSPVLSALTDTSDPAYVFSYLGQEQKNGLTVEHLRVSHKVTGDLDKGTLFRLSAMDFYLDASSLLPLAVDFKVHPNDNLNIDISEEILFANYQVVSGIQIPFHIARLLNGTVTLDAIVTSVLVNSGLPDAQFTLQ